MPERATSSVALHVKALTAALKEEAFAFAAADDAENGVKALQGRSLFLFAPRHPLRRACYAVLRSAAFENAVLVVIVLACITTALDEELTLTADPNPLFLAVIEDANIAWAASFLLEMLLRVVAQGALLGKPTDEKTVGPYLQEPWNRLDALVVAVSIVALLPAAGDFAVIRVFRTLRVLRPLRLAYRLPGLRVVVQSLLRSIPKVLSMLFLFIFFLLVMAILGVSQFGGRLAGCFDAEGELLSVFALEAAMRADPSIPAGDALAMCVWGSVRLGWAWVSPVPNFDSVPMAMQLLFECSTFDGWPDQMYAATDAAAEWGGQPVRDRQPANALYFVAAIVLFALFLTNLFVGVVIDNFNCLKAEMEGKALMTPSQKEWVEAQRLILRHRPIVKLKEPKHWLRRWAFRLVYTEQALEADTGRALTPNSEPDDARPRAPKQWQKARQWQPLVLQRQWQSDWQAEEQVEREASLKPDQQEIHQEKQLERQAGNKRQLERRVAPQHPFKDGNRTRVAFEETPSFKDLSKDASKDASKKNATKDSFKDAFKNASKDSFKKDSFKKDSFKKDPHKEETSSFKEPLSFKASPRSPLGARSLSSPSSPSSPPLSPPSRRSGGEGGKEKEREEERAGGREGDTAPGTEPEVSLVSWHVSAPNSPGLERARRASRRSAIVKQRAAGYYGIYFDAAIMGCVCLNVGFMATQYEGQPAALDQAQSWVSAGFGVIYATEAALKLLAFGPYRYLRDPWNVFDFLLVVLSLSSFAMALLADVAVLLGASDSSAASLNKPLSPSILRTVRVFRVLRVLKLVRALKQLRTLMVTLWFSLPALANIAVLLLLFVFIFAVLAMSLFGKVLVPDDSEQTGGLSRHANFSTFGLSVLTHFRMMFGEAWNAIMWDCIDKGYNNGVPTPVAVVFFVSYQFLMGFVCLNLAVAVILDVFDAAQHEEERKLKPAHVEHFARVWTEYDPGATHVIRTEQLGLLFRDAPEPLGFRLSHNEAADEKNVRECLTIAAIPNFGGRVHYVDVVTRLALYHSFVKRLHEDSATIGANRSSNARVMADVQRDFEMKYDRIFPSLRELPAQTGTSADCVEEIIAYTRRHALPLPGAMDGEAEAVGAGSPLKLQAVRVPEAS